MAREQLGAAPSGNNDAATKSYTDNAAVASAAKLTTPRTISLTGPVTGSVSFDGSANASMATTIGTNNNDNYANLRVIQNVNTSSPVNDGLYIGFNNSNNGVTRILGGGSTTNPMTFGLNTIDVGGVGDGNARFCVGHNFHGGLFRTFATDQGWFSCYFQRTGSVGVYNAFYYGGTQSGYISTSNGSNLLFISNSDHRLKQNVEPLESGVSTIEQLRPVKYEWKLDGAYGEGFIAHELQEVIPEAVSGVKDAELEDGTIVPQGIDMGKVVPHLVAAVQELKAELDAAKARIAQLEGQTNG